MTCYNSEFKNFVFIILHWQLKNSPLTQLLGHLVVWNDLWCQSHSQTEWSCTASSQCSDSWWLHTGQGELGHWWSVPLERGPRHSSLYWYSSGGCDRTKNRAGQAGRGCWHSLQSNVLSNTSKINMICRIVKSDLMSNADVCTCTTFIPS